MFENFFAYYKNAQVQEPPDPYEYDANDYISGAAARLRLSLPPDVMAMLMCTACLDPAGPNPTTYYRLLRQEIRHLWEEASANGDSIGFPLYDGENRMPEPAEFLFWLLIEYLHYLRDSQEHPYAYA